MNACFYVGPSSTEWCWKYFPTKSPGELPIAGKSWCRHLVDQCSRLKINDIFIADCYFHDDLTVGMGAGDYWSLRLHYLPSIPCPQPEQLFAQHQDKGKDAIRTDDDLLIFWGQVLPDLPDINQLLSNLREVTELPELLPNGIWLLRGGKYYECVCPLLHMRTLKEYFDLNFHLLEKPGIYNLPGYSNSEGCVFGMDVIIMPNCELESPLLIHDNVRLERGVSLRGKVILGEDVMINENSHLEHTLVLDHTYIGKHMQLLNMIVDGCRVIDVETGYWVDLEDEYLTGSSKEIGLNIYKLTELFLAFLIAFGGLPLFLVTLPFRPLLKKLGFFYFAFQMYPKCWEVLIGKAHLVRYGHRDSNYAFRYSDQWLLHCTERQKVTDDIYYYYNRTVDKIWKTVFVSLAKRLFVLGAQPGDRRPWTPPERDPQ